MKRKISLEEIDTSPSKKIRLGPFDTPPDSPTLAASSETKPEMKTSPSNEIWETFEGEAITAFWDEIVVPNTTGNSAEKSDKKGLAIQAENPLFIRQPAAAHEQATKERSANAGKKDTKPTREEARMAYRSLVSHVHRPGGHNLTVEEVLAENVWVNDQIKDKIRRRVKERYGLDSTRVRANAILDIAEKK
ncbi:MAG: hypothetical protein Q9167_002464 [Letrouitia subvulpina]